MRASRFSPTPTPTPTPATGAIGDDPDMGIWMNLENVALARICRGRSGWNALSLSSSRGFRMIREIIAGAPPPEIRPRKGSAKKR